VSDPEKYAPYGKHSRAIVTAGKSPEEVAQLVIAIVEARISGSRLAEEAANPPPTAKPAAEKQGADRRSLVAFAGCRLPVSEIQ
jgi:hypothetical protein